MALPKVEITKHIIQGVMTDVSKMLSRGQCWRLIYDSKGKVTHLFDSDGITFAPGIMECFETNEDAGVSIESKVLKCQKAVIEDDKKITKIEQDTTSEVPVAAKEKVFYAASVMDIEMYAAEKKLDVKDVSDYFEDNDNQTGTGE